MDEVQAIITFRSGKEIEQPGSKPTRKTKEKEDMEPEHIIINEDSMKKRMPPPPHFPKHVRQKEGFSARRHLGSSKVG